LNLPDILVACIGIRALRVAGERHLVTLDTVGAVKLSSVDKVIDLGDGNKAHRLLLIDDVGYAQVVKGKIDCTISIELRNPRLIPRTIVAVESFDSASDLKKVLVEVAVILVLKEANALSGDAVLRIFKLVAYIESAIPVVVCNDTRVPVASSIEVGYDLYTEQLGRDTGFITAVTVAHVISTVAMNADDFSRLSWGTSYPVPAHLCADQELIEIFGRIIVSSDGIGDK
jgi:hypothetical protein